MAWSIESKSSEEKVAKNNSKYPEWSEVKKIYEQNRELNKILTENGIIKNQKEVAKINSEYNSIKTPIIKETKENIENQIINFHWMEITRWQWKQMEKLTHEIRKIYANEWYDQKFYSNALITHKWAKHDLFIDNRIIWDTIILTNEWLWNILNTKDIEKINNYMWLYAKYLNQILWWVIKKQDM